MKLFNIAGVKPINGNDSRHGWIMVLEDNGAIYGWSDHRYKKLPIGKWIKFAGNNRMIKSTIAPVGDVKSYPNGFHAIFGRIDRDDLDYAQLLVPKWAAIKHKKAMKVKELKVTLRGIEHAGEMLMGDHGPDYLGCVCREIRISA